MQNFELLAFFSLGGGELTELIGILIPIIFIIMGIGSGMMTIYFSFRRRKEMFALFHQERMAAIEKGIELPPLPEEFFTESGKSSSEIVKRSSPHSKLLAGLVLTFLGLAVGCAMYFTGLRANALWSLVLIGMGAAFLIFYFAVDKKRADLIDAQHEAQVAANPSIQRK
jgi:hypothetical protein